MHSAYLSINVVFGTPRCSLAQQRVSFPSSSRSMASGGHGSTMTAFRSWCESMRGAAGPRLSQQPIMQQELLAGHCLGPEKGDSIPWK